MMAVVPNLIDQPPEEKYEQCFNELIEFLESRYLAIDIKALRILMAAVFEHVFGDGPALPIWMSNAPPLLDQAIGRALGQLLHAPKPYDIAKLLREQTGPDRSLYMLTGIEGIFHQDPGQIEALMRTIAEVSAGELEWNSPRLPPFIWNGRVTCIASVWRPLDYIQVDRCLKVWPLVQNAVTAVRFEKLANKVYVAAPKDDRDVMNQEAVKTLRQMIINLMDVDNRDPRAKVTETAAEVTKRLQLTYLIELVQSVRGAAFDTEHLKHRAVRLATAHARMMGKPATDAEDHSLVRKCLLDSIPPSVLAFLRRVPPDGWWTYGDARKFGKQTKPTTLRLLEALSSAQALLVAPQVRQGLRRGAIHYCASAELRRLQEQGV